MGDENIYRNTPVDTVSNATNCGVVTLSVAAAVYVTSQPCRECWIKTASANTVFVNLNAVAAASAGFALLANSALNMAAFGPLAISNLSAINLYSAAVATVWIVWRG